MKKLAYQEYIDNNLYPSDNEHFSALFFEAMKQGRIPNAVCYFMGKDFSEQLMNVKADILPDILFNINDQMYIEFAEDIWLNDSAKFSGVIVFRTKSGKLMICLFDTRDYHIGSMACVFTKPADESITIDKMVDMLPTGQDGYVGAVTSNKTNFKLILSFAINCILYVISGSPDLRTVRPPACKAKSNKGKKKFSRDFPLPIPLIYVGYNYKKSNFYHVDGTTVKGHFRWQPYGEKLSKVKLIWIDSYEKHFNK